MSGKGQDSGGWGGTRAVHEEEEEEEAGSGVELMSLNFNSASLVRPKKCNSYLTNNQEQRAGGLQQSSITVLGKDAASEYLNSKTYRSSG